MLAALEQSNMVIYKMVQTSCLGPVDDAGALALGGWTGAETLPIFFFLLASFCSAEVAGRTWLQCTQGLILSTFRALGVVRRTT